MSWKDFYRRRDVIDAVLRQARRDPEGELPFAEVAGAEKLFGTKQDFLVALHHKWTLLLSGYLRAESACPDDAGALLDQAVINQALPNQEGDQIDAVSRAWKKATREHPTLRAVLDAHIDDSATLLAMHRAEQRMLAVTAGLVEPYEPVAEITKIGVAFDALLRSGPARPARRRGPVGHLLRMLAPSA